MCVYIYVCINTVLFRQFSNNHLCTVYISLLNIHVLTRTLVPYISATNVLLEYLNIVIVKFYIDTVMQKFMSILSIHQYIMAALV